MISERHNNFAEYQRADPTIYRVVRILPLTRKRRSSGKSRNLRVKGK